MTTTTVMINDNDSPNGWTTTTTTLLVGLTNTKCEETLLGWIMAISIGGGERELVSCRMMCCRGLGGDRRAVRTH